MVNKDETWKNQWIYLSTTAQFDLMSLFLTLKLLQALSFFFNFELFPNCITNLFIKLK